MTGLIIRQSQQKISALKGINEPMAIYFISLYNAAKID